MGASCKGKNNVDMDIFEYRFGEDDKEKNIKHSNGIPCSLDAIRTDLDECSNKLNESEKRFKDTMLNTEPLQLICDNRKLHCHFERPDNFLKRDANLRNKIYKIFDLENCRPSNIHIGDDVMQYFGVFLCYLADHPELIESMILTEPNSYGIQVVYMVHEGRRRPLYIDDYVLCYKEGPLFSQPIKNTDMWPCILEKAWFKYKSFLKTGIEKTHPLELFKSFLMFPMTPIYLNGTSEHNQQQIHKHLVTPFLNRESGGTIVTSKLKPDHKIGLSGRKHYYLMKIFDIDNNIYYYLRNPCGAFDFRGLLQLKDMPEELRKRIISVTGEYPPDGNFLLNQQEFSEQIETFFVVKYSEQAPILSELEIPFARYEDEEVFLKFRIEKDQPIGLRLHQLHKAKGYDPLTYLLLDLQRKTIVTGLHNEEGCFGLEESNLLSTPLQTVMPGQYLLRLKRKSNQTQKEKNKNKQIITAMLAQDVLIANGSQTIDFQLSEGSEYKPEFHEILKEIAKKELRQGGGVRGEGDIEHVVMWMGDIVILFAQKSNGSKDEIQMEVNFPDLTNLECITHKFGKGYSAVPPFRGQLLVIFQKINLSAETLLGNYSILPY